MRVDLVDLRLFLHVAEAGSITRGAERAHLALASASERIRGLEDEAGVALLERGRRGVALTAAGRALSHHARVVLQQVERMQGELGLYAGGLRGHVRLLANTAALSEFLPEALAAFLAAHPRIDIDLEERSSWAIVQAIAAGEAEIGLVADTVDLGALEVVPFRPDRLVLVTPRGHPLGERRRVAFAETLDQPFVGLGEDSALQAHLAGHAARLGRRPDHRVRLRSFEAVCRMVEQGVGIAVVPEAAARRAARSLRIRRVRLADPWAARRLMIAVRRRDELTPAARLLAETLQGAAPSS